MERRFTKIETYDKSFCNNLEKLRHVLIILSGKNNDETNNSSKSLIPDNKNDINITDIPNAGPGNNDMQYSK